MKLCNRCGCLKSRAAFYDNPNSHDGRMSICKDCHKLAMKKNRIENPEVQARERARAKLPHRRAAAAENVTRWRREHPDEYRAQNAINNAIRDGKVDREPCGQCGSAENVFGVATDPSRPLMISWRCALCHHRGRFQPKDTSCDALPNA